MHPIALAGPKRGHRGVWTLFVGALALAFWPLPVRADLAVNWGGNYVSANQPLEGENSAPLETGDFDGEADLTDSRDGRLWTTSVAMNPTSGYAGTSQTFYGAGVLTREDDAAGPGAWTAWRVTNGAGADMIEISKTGPVSSRRALHAFTYWDKTDFLNGLSAPAPLSFTTTSSLSVTFGSSAQQIGDARWLVRDGAQFYVSEAQITVTGGSTRTLTFGSDSNDGNWATYSPPTANLGINFDQSGASFSARNFSDITAVGFYLEQDGFTLQPVWQMSDFDAVLTPEPGSIVLLGVSALVGLARRAASRRSRVAPRVE